MRHDIMNPSNDIVSVRVESDGAMLLSVRSRGTKMSAVFELSAKTTHQLITMLQQAIDEAEKEKQ